MQYTKIVYFKGEQNYNYINFPNAYLFIIYSVLNKNRNEKICAVPLNLFFSNFFFLSLKSEKNSKKAKS